MRKGIGHPSHWLMTAAENYDELGRDEKFSLS
jgi:hypothetical protein